MPTAVRTQRSDDRHSAILDAALRSFARKGYAATTIDDVRRGSGASVGSLYHHFGGKEALAAAVYIAGLERYQRLILGQLETAAGAEAGIRAAIDAHFRFVEVEGDLARYLLTRREPEVMSATRAPVRKLNREFARRIGKWLAPHQGDGAIRELPFEVLAALVIGPCQELTRVWLGERTGSVKWQMVEQLQDCVWRAVKGPATYKGDTLAISQQLSTETAAPGAAK